MTSDHALGPADLTGDGPLAIVHGMGTSASVESHTAHTAPRDGPTAASHADEAERCDRGLRDLLARVGLRDESALSSFYEETVARVYALALRITGRGDAAEEVCADVYLPPDRASALRQRIMYTVRAADAEQNGPPLTRTIRAVDGEWKTIAPGVHVKALYKDGEARTYLLRIDPGGVVPGHRHDIDEECIVLEGEAFLRRFSRCRRRLPSSDARQCAHRHFQSRRSIALLSDPPGPRTLLCFDRHG